VRLSRGRHSYPSRLSRRTQPSASNSPLRKAATICDGAWKTDQGARFWGPRTAVRPRRRRTPSRDAWSGAAERCRWPVRSAWSKTTVQPGDKGQVPREHLGLVLRVAVHGTESPAGADRPVAHHPAQVVCQNLIHFSGRRTRRRWSPLVEIDGEVARHREPVVALIAGAGRSRTLTLSSAFRS